MKISQRTAKISVVLNILLIGFCLALLIYANFQRAIAEKQSIVAQEQRLVAEQQVILAERARDRADSAAKEAIRQREIAKEMIESDTKTQVQ